VRVTEGRLISVAADAVSKGRERVEKAGQELSSGVRVAAPSDDGTAWAEGMRANARLALSQSRGTAIARANDRLRDTELALQPIGDAVSRALELAVQMSNATMSASERSVAAIEVRGLRERVLDAANTRADDGEYLLA